MGIIANVLRTLKESEQKMLTDFVKEHGTVSFCTINIDEGENDYYYPDGGEVLAYIYNDNNAMLEPCVIHEFGCRLGQTWVIYSQYDEDSNSYDYYHDKWLSELDFKAGDIEYIIEKAQEFLNLI